MFGFLERKSTERWRRTRGWWENTRKIRIQSWKVERLIQMIQLIPLHYRAHGKRCRVLLYIYIILIYIIYIYRVCAWCWMHIGVFDAAVPGLPKGRRVGQFRATHHGETATTAFAQLECPVWAWSVERVECRNEKTWDNYMNFMDQFCIIHDNSTLGMKSFA